MTNPTPAAGSSGTRPGGPPALSPAFFLMTLGRQIRVDVDTALSAHDLALRHVSVLGHLARQPGLSYSELARRADVTFQSMQATLLQLEQRGAVQKRTQPGRGRTAQLHLTAIGEQLLAHGKEAITAADHRVLGALPAEQAQHLTDLLFRLVIATARQKQPPTEPGAVPADGW